MNEEKHTHPGQMSTEQRQKQIGQVVFNLIMLIGAALIMSALAVSVDMGSAVFFEVSYILPLSETTRILIVIGTYIYIVLAKVAIEQLQKKGFISNFEKAIYQAEA